MQGSRNDARRPLVVPLQLAWEKFRDCRVNWRNLYRKSQSWTIKPIGPIERPRKRRNIVVVSFCLFRAFYCREYTNSSQAQIQRLLLLQIQDVCKRQLHARTMYYHSKYTLLNLPNSISGQREAIARTSGGPATGGGTTHYRGCCWTSWGMSSPT